MRQLAVSGLHKAFGSQPVLTGLDLDVPAGAFTAILGPSGSGKTTLLRLLAGFERADAGTIMIGDRMVDGPDRYLPPERRRIGYVPQEGALFPHLSIAANVGFGLPARQRRGHRTDELLDAVGLAGLGQRYPHQLSGGQQQRVALARALAIRPEVVLLDEPFASLDAHMRASVRADVQRICREAGTTAVLVTHDQDEALSLADRVAVLRDGQIVQYAPPQDLYMRPADPALARFIGEANLLDGTVAGPVAPGTVDTVLGRLPLVAGSAGPAGAGPVTVLIRPEQLELVRHEAGNEASEAGDVAPAGASGQSGRPGCLAGHVVACEYYGHDAVVRVRAATDTGAGMPEMIIRTAGGPQLPAGSPVLIRATGPVIAWSR